MDNTNKGVIIFLGVFTIFLIFGFFLNYFQFNNESEPNLIECVQIQDSWIESDTRLVYTGQGYIPITETEYFVQVYSELFATDLEFETDAHLLTGGYLELLWYFEENTEPQFLGYQMGVQGC